MRKNVSSRLVRFVIVLYVFYFKNKSLIIRRILLCSNPFIFINVGILCCTYIICAMCVYYKMINKQTKKGSVS